MIQRVLPICLLICLLQTIPVPLWAQKTDAVLHKQLKAMADTFHGDIGWYILNLKQQSGSFYQEDSLFPTASIVKVPIMAGIVQQLERGELSYHQPLVYKDSLLYEGEDILGSFKHGETITLNKVMMLMLTTSDNTASLWLQSLAGGGTAINQLMERSGFTHTRVNSRTPGRESNRAQFGWGQTTPKEMAQLFRMIVERRLINAHASDMMLRLLSRNFWDEQAIGTIPPDVFVASKNGAVNASRSEVLYVNGRKTPYIFCVFTKNNSDTSWEPTNEAWQLTIRMSRLVWNHYNGN